jgi:undecaprenyl-diphosphatase
LYFPALAVLFLPLAIFVGISRIFLGLHYPSDVLIGSLLGMVTGTGAFLLMQFLFPALIS